MALTFRKLEVFVAVAEDGNFRKAAERLGISQPSVSSQIKSMERYLGYQLFECIVVRGTVFIIPPNQHIAQSQMTAPKG
jgi:molybdenum-dependent DNA-binding transcriptional regulator ModE